MLNTTLQLSTPNRGFTWFDHSTFALLLGVSATIGIWFGYCGKKEDTTTEYLFGGRTMGVIPTSLSMVASTISGLTILGSPSDIYMFGTSYWLGTFNLIPIGFAVAYIYLPVFFKLQLTSVYEYLELRFNSKIRIAVSFLTLLLFIIIAPITIYIPALAFSQVTGFHIHYITPIVCFICIFYTSIGGIKAVIWTDAIQFVGMFAGAIAVLVLGVNSLGGFEHVWNISQKGGRIDFFNMDPDPTLRNSFWSVQFGLFFTWLSNCVTQASVQRFMAFSTMRQAKQALVIWVLGAVVITSISSFIGLILYAKYSDCDPVTSGQIKNADQILPYFVIDVASHVYGLPGIFIAGVFSAALSTLSTILNCAAAVVYKDFISSYMPRDISEKRVNNILKIIVVIAGIISTLLVFIVEKLGGVLQVFTSLAGVANGPVLGLFTLGMVFPVANSKGAFYGCITSFAVMATIVCGSQYHIAQKHIVYPPKPLSVEGCNFTFSPTSNTTFLSKDEPPFFLFRISYYYFTLIGTLLVILVGLPVSWLTKSKSHNVDLILVSPAFHWLLPEDQKHPPPSYKTVQNALKSVTHIDEEVAA